MITLKQIRVVIEVVLAVKVIKSKETRREFSFLTRTFCTFWWPNAVNVDKLSNFTLQDLVGVVSN